MKLRIFQRHPGGEANHEAPKGRKPESRTVISHDKNMGGQENGGLVDLPVHYLPVNYVFLSAAVGPKRRQFTSADYFLVFFGLSSFRAFVITGFSFQEHQRSATSKRAREGESLQNPLLARRASVAHRDIAVLPGSVAAHPYILTTARPSAKLLHIQMDSRRI
ncbi:MAG: hypothetical protein ABSG68_04545 [Thermoguttaceae bacterium]